MTAAEYIVRRNAARSKKSTSEDTYRRVYAKVRARSSASKLTRYMGKYGKLLAGTGVTLFGLATFMDIDRGLRENADEARELHKQELELVRRDNIARRKRNAEIAGLPGDPFLGMVQNMFDQRTNHTRM